MDFNNERQALEKVANCPRPQSLNLRQSKMTQLATPVLYLNMGGEMMYVLQQRLHTQGISVSKSNQVLSDVIYALLNHRQLMTMFDRASPLLSMSSLRAILERVVLSSIMKLDFNSMNKLFDLMIMMVKYQLTTATGPREVLLSTLNHLDAIRDMAGSKSLREHVDFAHRLVIESYGMMTHKEVWQIRNECLRQIQNHNVRVSILLRLGMQNEDSTFNRLIQRYDEKYYERHQVLDNVKLVDYHDEDGFMGSISFYGCRETLLGTNVYSSSFGHVPNSRSNQNLQKLQLQQSVALCSKSMRNELDTLAVQLGKEDTTPTRPFSLHLFNNNDIDKGMDCSPDNTKLDLPSKDEDNNLLQDNKTDTLVNDYRNKLIENINSQFADDSPKREDLDLMNMLDNV